MKIHIFAWVACMILAALTTGVADGQSTPTSPALTALQEQQAEFDARLKIVQDQQALATAPFPSSTTQPNSGAYTVSGSNPFASQRLAYRDLQALADLIAKVVETKVTSTNDQGSKKTIFIYDPTQVAAVMNVIAVEEVLKTLTSQVTSLNGYFDSTLRPEIIGLASPPRNRKARTFVLPLTIMAGLKTTSDLLGMFRSNTTINYASFSTDNAALTADVTNRLLADGCRVYEPALMSINMKAVHSPLMDRLNDVYSEVSRLQYEVSVDQAQLQLASNALEAWISATIAAQANRDLIASETDATKLSALKEKQPGLDGAVDAALRYVIAILKWPANTKLDMTSASALKGERDRVLNKLTAVSSAISGVATSVGAVQSALLGISNTGGAASAAVLSAEQLLDSARKDNGAFLSLNSAVLGGSVVTRVNLFTGGHLLYTGGAIASYTLFDLNGEVSASGVVTGKGGTEKASF